MNIKDKVHSLVISSPGGIAALAARMGVPYSTLKSKLNPNTNTHHLYVEEIEQIVELLETDEIAKHFASQRDGVFVKSHQLDGVSDIELLDLFLEREEKYGNFAKQVRRALEDGGIDDAEYEDLMRNYDAVSEVREQIRARLKHIHEQTVARAGRLKAVR